VAFITARQSAERMRQRIPGLDAIWMPEGIDPARYRGDKPLKERSIHVLEMGRLYDRYHQQIQPHCSAVGYVHKFQPAPWQHAFQTEQEFYDGLADSKISICFPRCMTHPHLAGDVETLTLRYLESIACKCIIVGHCPAELRELFGYDPVVAADLNNANAQLDRILGDSEDYSDLLERNYERLLEVGAWETRMNKVRELLLDRGYRW
jgi:hypothetical protein